MLHEYVHSESPKILSHISLPNRNDMNQQELPLLFHVAMLLAHVSASGSPLLGPAGSHCAGVTPV